MPSRDLHAIAQRMAALSPPAAPPQAPEWAAELLGGLTVSQLSILTGVLDRALGDLLAASVDGDLTLEIREIRQAAYGLGRSILDGRRAAPSPP